MYQNVSITEQSNYIKKSRVRTVGQNKPNSYTLSITLESFKNAQKVEIWFEKVWILSTIFIVYTYTYYIIYTYIYI